MLTEAGVDKDVRAQGKSSCSSLVSICWQDGIVGLRGKAKSTVGGKEASRATTTDGRGWSDFVPQMIEDSGVTGLAWNGLEAFVWWFGEPRVGRRSLSWESWWACLVGCGSQEKSAPRSRSAVTRYRQQERPTIVQSSCLAGDRRVPGRTEDLFFELFYPVWSID